jgi:hypothetical protein
MPEETRGDMKFASMLKPDVIRDFISNTLLKKVLETPADNGDLVYVLSDPTALNDGSILNIFKPLNSVLNTTTSTATDLQAVPLAVVTKAVHKIPVKDRVLGRDEQDFSDDLGFVAVRRFTGGEDSELYQMARCIPIRFLPKLAQDAISVWPTPEGNRKVSFGVPFADSKDLEDYGEGNLYLACKSAPHVSMGTKKLPSRHFALQVWTYEAGMLFRLDDSLLNRKACGPKGSQFAKDANPTEGGGNLMLLALRTFKYDTLTGEPCSYSSTEDALTVVMAYVATSSSVVKYAKCLLRGTDVEGPTGPVIYEIPFRKLSFPPEYEYLAKSLDDHTYPIEMAHDILQRLVSQKRCGAPININTALNQGSPLGPFSGGEKLQATLMVFKPEVSSLSSRSLAA